MEGKHSKFITGALVGLGLGLLIAPTEGSESRKELKKSLENLLDTIKDIDIEKTKSAFMKRLNDIKKELVRIKINKIKETCLGLIDVAKENKVPKVEEAVQEVLLKTDDILENIDSKKKVVTVKKKTTPKTRVRKTVTKKTVKKKTDK